MKLFLANQTAILDQSTISLEPVSSIDLMERAANAACGWIQQHLSTSSVTIFCGPGNNGGDGLALARLLKEQGCPHVQVYLGSAVEQLSDDARTNYNRLQQTEVKVSEVHPEQLPFISSYTLVVDALFGVGLSRPLSGHWAQLVQHINDNASMVVSIDMPSGLMGEDNCSIPRDSIVDATYTLTFQQPKLAFMFAENEPQVGEWVALPIGLHPDALMDTPTPYHYMLPNEVAGLLRDRPRFAHKGTFGKAFLLAGSHGMMGAAVLASKACYRTGAGWLKVHCAASGLNIMQISVPEAIIEPQQDNALPHFTESYTAIAAGPGIGQDLMTQERLKALLQASRCPMVLDADALNILSKHRDWLTLVPPMSILTPHRREMERLVGESVACDYHLLMKQLAFSQEHNVIVVLKGANTSIALPDGRVYFNSTGNPGMAKAGSGDVLTGMLLSLLSQGYEPECAARLGVFLHGLAGDLAASRMGQEAMMPSDLINEIGHAFQKLRSDKNTSLI